MRVILDPKYEKENLHKAMETKCKHLTMTQHNDLLKLLQKFEELTDGTIGTWRTYPVDLELKENGKPVRSQLYSVPKVHEEMFKEEVECLVLLGFPEVEKDSEWGYPSFS